MIDLSVLAPCYVFLFPTRGCSPARKINGESLATTMVRSLFIGCLLRTPEVWRLPWIVILQPLTIGMLYLHQLILKLRT